jgi:hypothetical protein
MREKEKYTSDASTPAEADEALRRLAAERLADHLEIGISLAGHCEMLAGKTKGDRLGPVYAAARLMRANAAVAEALANVAQIERRRRSIVERVQTPDPKKAELNSRLQEEKSAAEERLKLLKHVDGLLEQMSRGGKVDEGEKARLARVVQDQLSMIEGLRGEEVDAEIGDTIP